MGPHCLVGLVILILASTELQVTGAALKPGRGQARSRYHRSLQAGGNNHCVISVYFAC